MDRVHLAAEVGEPGIDVAPVYGIGRILRALKIALYLCDLPSPTSPTDSAEEPIVLSDFDPEVTGVVKADVVPLQTFG